MKDRLRLIRKDSKMTQTEFANALGVGRDAVTSYELGRVVPTKAYLLLVCREFGVNPEWLNTGEGEPYKRGLIPRLVQVLKSNQALLAALEQAVDRMDDQDWQNLNAIVEKVISNENSPEP